MSLGDRMKLYEGASVFTLPPRMPTIIRVDGKAFHTWAANCEQPFDETLMRAMDAAAARLCEVVQTTVCAYVQSDEISLLLHPYKRYSSQPWFGGELHKLVSVSASVAAGVVTACNVPNTRGPAFFDARAFVLPGHEVPNYFLWRQQDAERNSVQMLARSIFSHRECHRKNCDQLRSMCATQGSPWEGLTSHQRSGRFVMRSVFEREGATRSAWAVQPNTPTFRGSAGRTLFEALLATEENESESRAQTRST